MSLIRHRRRTFWSTNNKETGMQKWAGMLVKTGKAFVDSSAVMTQMRKDSDFWSLPPLTILCWRKHIWSSQGIQKMDMALPKWTTPQPDWLHSSEEVLPIRSEHCQNTKFSRSRHWKWSRLSDDDLPPSPEKNQQAKTHKTQVLPRKAERSQRVGNLPSHDRREVCSSHHHEQRRYRHRFNADHLRHSTDWNS